LSTLDWEKGFQSNEIPKVSNINNILMLSSLIHREDAKKEIIT